MMKRGNKTALSLFVVLVITVTDLFGQEPVAPGMGALLNSRGYVILGTGDTVRGIVSTTWKYVENNPVELKLTYPNGVTVLYNADAVRGFGYQNDYFGITENWVSVPSLKKKIPVFMNRLVWGRITVFQNRSAIVTTTSKPGEKIKGPLRIEGINFEYIPGEGLFVGLSLAKNYREIEYSTSFSSFYVSIDDKPLVKVSKSEYSELFSELFGNCPGLQEEIARNPELKEYRNFLILAEVYNNSCKR